MRIVLYSVVFAGCWTASPPAPPPVQPHHKEVLAARDAVVAGDADNARAALTALNERLPTLGLDGPRSRPFAESVGRGAAAGDIKDLARAIGMAGAACGSCHRSVGSLPPEEAGERPTADASVKQQMRLHQWAALTLWDGLVRGDTPAFANAAQGLQAMPMVPSGTAVDAPIPREAVALELRVHNLAAKAARVDTLSQRGSVVGDLLATCQSCHDLLDGGPR